MITLRAERVQRVVAALVLRRVILRYLAPSGAGEPLGGLAAASTETWSLLLRVECCALPLAARLRNDGRLDQLGEGVRRLLHDAESAELQRVLAARLIVRELDDVAAQAGIRLSLLKGAAAAADPSRQPLDLGDVDVLADGADASAAWSGLLARGWTPIIDGLAPGEGLGARVHYAPLRSSRHQLEVELHERFEYGNSRDVGGTPATVPIAGCRALDRIAGVSNVVGTLQHCVVKHPHRRGHLRDLFLLADALAELDDAAMAEVDLALREEEYDVELRAMLEQARALCGRGGDLRDAPTTRAFVAWKYASAAGTSPLVSAGPRGWWTMTQVPLERRALRGVSYRRLLFSAIERVPADSSAVAVRWLSSAVSRRLGIPRLARSLYRLMLTTALVLVAGRIRHHISTLEEMSNRA